MNILKSQHEKLYKTKIFNKEASLIEYNIQIS